jgi:hypothetical protein
MTQHLCPEPAPASFDADDWTCPECGQSWFAGTETIEVPRWEKFGTGDGTFPVASTNSSLIDYFPKAPS